jgi:hypothetical protein
VGTTAKGKMLPPVTESVTYIVLLIYWFVPITAYERQSPFSTEQCFLKEQKR